MLGIIIVNYKTIDETVHYVQQELCKIKIPYRIVIVNVGCNDQTNALLTRKLQACFVADIHATIDSTSNVFVLAEPKNVGYAQGNNLGAAFFKIHFNMEHYLISNNDIQLTDDKVVSNLMNKLDTLPATGAIGPKIVGCDGEDQSPAKKISIWKALIIPALFYPLVYFFLKKGYFADVISNAREGTYYRLSGAFFLVKRVVFDAVNGFDPNTFLFAEEMIFSERMLAAGYHCYFLPSVLVLHEQGKVIKNNLTGLAISRHSLASKLYYYGKYCGATFFSLCIARFASEIFYKLYRPIILWRRKIAKK